MLLEPCISYFVFVRTPPVCSTLGRGVDAHGAQHERDAGVVALAHDGLQRGSMRTRNTKRHAKHESVSLSLCLSVSLSPLRTRSGVVSASARPGTTTANCKAARLRFNAKCKRKRKRILRETFMHFGYKNRVVRVLDHRALASSAQRSAPTLGRRGRRALPAE